MKNKVPPQDALRLGRDAVQDAPEDGHRCQHPIGELGVAEESRDSGLQLLLVRLRLAGR